MKEEMNIKRPMKLVIGCFFLVSSGFFFGLFNCGNGSITIAILYILCLFVGMSILFYREEQLNKMEERRC